MQKQASIGVVAVLSVVAVLGLAGVICFPGTADPTGIWQVQGSGSVAYQGLTLQVLPGGTFYLRTPDYEAGRAQPIQGTWSADGDRVTFRAETFAETLVADGDRLVGGMTGKAGASSVCASPGRNRRRRRSSLWPGRRPNGS